MPSLPRQVRPSRPSRSSAPPRRRLLDQDNAKPLNTREALSPAVASETTSFPETVSVSAQRCDRAALETVGADPTLSSGHQPAQRRAARCQNHAHRHAGRDAYVILAAPAGDLLILVERAAAPGATLARLAVAGDDGQWPVAALAHEVLLSCRTPDRECESPFSTRVRV